MLRGTSKDSLYSLISDSFQNYQDSIAVEESNREISYRELDLLSRKISRFIDEETTEHPSKLIGVSSTVNMDRSLRCWYSSRGTCVRASRCSVSTVLVWLRSFQTQG